MLFFYSNIGLPLRGMPPIYLRRSLMMRINVSRRSFRIFARESIVGLILTSILVAMLQFVAVISPSVSTALNSGSIYLHNASINTAFDSALDIDAGQFTMEMWIKPTASGAQGLYSGNQNGGQLGYQDSTCTSNQSRFFTGIWGEWCNSNTGALGVVPNINSWKHVVMQREANNKESIYLNGSRLIYQDGTNRLGMKDDQANAKFMIGAVERANFTGYISNFRLVTGGALYSGATLTVPTTELTTTAASGTVKLLMSATSNETLLIDTVSNRVFTTTATKTANPTATSGTYSYSALSPFDDPNNGSIAFTRTAGPNDQNLTTAVIAPGTDSLTYEWWFKYTDDTLPNMGMLVTRNGGSGCDGIDATIGNGKLIWGKCSWISNGELTLPKNQWNHIAFVRTGSTSWVVYLNGESKLTYSTTAVDTPTTSTYLRIGRKYGDTETFSGNITNFRYVKGVAVYTGNFTVPTSQLMATQNSGTNISAITGSQTQLLLNMRQGAATVNDSIVAATISTNGTITSSSETPFLQSSVTTHTASNSAPTFGSSITLTANVTSGATGTVVFKDASDTTLCTTGNLAAGSANCSWTPASVATYAVRAVYAGNAAYTGSSSTAANVVVKTATTATHSASNSSPTFGSSVTLTAAVTSGATGTVIFKDASDTTLCTTGNLATGSADCSWTPASAATYAVRAVYAGDATYGGSSSTAADVIVGKATQTITFNSPGDKVFGSGTVSLVATSTSALTVALTSATTGICTMSGTTLTLAAVGTCTVNANQSGNSNYEAANQVQQTFTIAKADQSITFSGITSKALSAGTLAISATGGASGNPVTFTSATAAKCTVAETTVTFVAAGTCTINSNQAASDNYNAATQVSQSFSIAATPVISDTSASSITSTSTSLNFTSSSTGNYYLLVYAAATTAPTAVEVIAQGTAVKKATSSVLASINTVSITGLTAATAYKAYVVVKDALNVSSDLSTITFSTLMTAPNAPGFRSAQVKVIADNDYAVYMGDDLNITRLLHQSNVDWPSQVASIGTLDVFPLAGESYIYVLAMGGNGSFKTTPTVCGANPPTWSCGQEDWSGTINGKSVFNYAGAEVAVGRSISDPSKTDYLQWGYLLLNNYLTGFSNSQGAVAGGTFSVSFATANTAITNVIWGPATLANHDATTPIRTNCTVSCREIDAGVAINAWAFPDASAVIFRYPLSNAELPVAAGDKQVIVDWDAPVGGGAVTKYLVDYKESSELDAAYKSFSEVASGTTIETVTGLTNGTSYTFRVTAVNNGGTASSVSRAVTPTGPPSQPLNLSYAAGAGYVDVSFTAPENNGGFTITNYSYSTDNGSTWITRSPQSTISPLRISGLTDGTTYQIKIKAINPSGAGAASVAVAAKPGITVNRTITYASGTLATVTGLPTGGTYVAGNTFLVAAGPSRANFTFTGWKEGATSYLAGDTFTVAASNSTLTAQWTQDSLLGTLPADRSRVLTWNILADTAVDATVSGGADNSVRVQIPANALAAGTEVIFWRLLNDNVAKSKINSGNSYIVNLAVTWSIGDDITVAKTVQTAAAPLVLTVTNGSIKAGATAWQIVGDNVRVIGTASQDGVLNLSFTEDPVIAAANVANPPVFGAAVSTVDGFTVSITNYDGAYVWETPTVSAGSIAITSTVGANRLLTVTGLTLGQSATVSQTNSLAGVANSSRTTTVTGNAIAGNALTPVFGTPTSVSGGFTVLITNYDASYSWATPTVNTGSVVVTSTSGTNRLLTVSGLTSGASATVTQTNSRTGYTNGSATVSGTAITVAPIVVVTPVDSTPAPTPIPTPVVQAPAPSILKSLTSPTISRDESGYYCQVGKYIFLREGRTEEAPKLTTQTFSLLQNGKVVSTQKSELDKAAFLKNDSYIESTLSCQIEATQESLTTTVTSNVFEVSAQLLKAKNSAIAGADTKYYKDRENAYAKKSQEFANLAAVKVKSLAAAKSSKESIAARLAYRKAFTAASNLWKKELADASYNRILAKELAQKEYLAALESAGISIYPMRTKAAVTPTPTVTPKPEATPTTSPTATNVQPTPEMKKVGTVYMASGSYFLNDATKSSLKALAKKMSAAAIKQVLVYGHTDNRAGVNNTVLSQQRAKAVANYLRPLLPGKKIVIGWYASRKPLATGNSKADLAKNRRVEIYQR